MCLISVDSLLITHCKRCSIQEQDLTALSTASQSSLNLLSFPALTLTSSARQPNLALSQSDECAPQPRSCPHSLTSASKRPPTLHFFGRIRNFSEVYLQSIFSSSYHCSHRCLEFRLSTSSRGYSVVEQPGCEIGITVFPVCKELVVHFHQFIRLTPPLLVIRYPTVTLQLAGLFKEAHPCLHDIDRVSGFGESGGGHYALMYSYGQTVIGRRALHRALQQPTSVRPDLRTAVPLVWPT